MKALQPLPADDQTAAAEVGEIIEELAAIAQEQAGDPKPVAQGTFALYAMPDGGVMFVTDVAEGRLAGTTYQRIPPALIRGIAALTGGSKLKAVTGAAKEFFGIGTRKQKAIDSGR